MGSRLQTSRDTGEDTEEDTGEHSDTETFSKGGDERKERDISMEEFGSGLVQVKQCEGEVMGMVPGSIVTSVANNNNNNKFPRCEGCGELIMDRFVMRLSE